MIPTFYSNHNQYINYITYFLNMSKHPACRKIYTANGLTSKHMLIPVQQKCFIFNLPKKFTPHTNYNQPPKIYCKTYNINTRPQTEYGWVTLQPKMSIIAFNTQTITHRNTASNTHNKYTRYQ